MFVIGEGEIAIQLHDLEQVTDYRMNVEEHDLALTRLHAPLQSDQDGDTRAGKIIDLEEIQGHSRLSPALNQVVKSITQGIVAEVVQAGGTVESDDQGVGFLARIEGRHTPRTSPWRLSRPPCAAPIGSSSLMHNIKPLNPD